MLRLNNFGSTSMTDDLSFSPKTSKLLSLMIIVQSCLMWRQGRKGRERFSLFVSTFHLKMYINTWLEAEME